MQGQFGAVEQALRASLQDKILESDHDRRTVSAEAKFTSFPRHPPGGRMAQSLWDFSVELYARPGVAAACLALQDRAGADVCLLLAALWLERRGVALEAVRVTEAAALACARLMGRGDVAATDRAATEAMRKAFRVVTRWQVSFSRVPCPIGPSGAGTSIGTLCGTHVGTSFILLTSPPGHTPSAASCEDIR